MSATKREYRIIKEDVRPRTVRYGVHLVYVDLETGFMQASTLPDVCARYADDWEDLTDVEPAVLEVLRSMALCASKPILHWVEGRLEELPRG